MSNNGMSKEMYDFIIENEHKLRYDLVNGLVITPKGTNGTVCSTTGYLRVKVSGKVLQVHQILAVKYYGENCIGMQINHEDGNKLNNTVENLTISTQKENIQHAWRTGLYENAKDNGKKGEQHYNSKLSLEEIEYIKNSKDKTKVLSEKFNVSARHIRNIRSNNSWKHVS